MTLAEFAFNYLARPMLIEEHTEHGCAVIANGIAAVHSCLLSFVLLVLFSIILSSLLTLLLLLLLLLVNSLLCPGAGKDKTWIC